jgi:DNA (cytosine-5)-methyltransferase 1
MKLETYATHFASIGGACWGMEQAGLKCVHAIEKEQIRVDYREKNIGHKATCMDISEYEPRKEHAADVLWTSPPCKMLSTLSRSYVNLNHPMNQLYLKSVRYCEVCRPQYFILENVLGILTHNADGIASMTLSCWQKDFEKLGYHCEYNVLNSKYFCVPQNRERVFMVGSLNGRRDLIPAESNVVSSKIGDIMEHGVTRKCWSPDTYRTVLDAVARNSARTRSPYRFLLLGPDDIFPTITCGFDGGATRKKVGIIDRVGDAWFLRQPTVREGARAQGFPDSWVLPESDTIAWNMVGDAVTSNVSRAIARHLVSLEAGARPAAKRELSAQRIPRYALEMHNDLAESIDVELGEIENL